MSDLRRRLDQVSANVRAYRDAGTAIQQAQGEHAVAEDLAVVATYLAGCYKVSVALGIQQHDELDPVMDKIVAIRDLLKAPSSGLDVNALKSLAKECRRVSDVLAERNRHEWSQVKSEVAGEGQKSLLEAAGKLGVEGIPVIVISMNRIANRSNPTLDDVRSAKDLRIKIDDVVTKLTGNDPEVTDFVKKLTAPTGVELEVVDDGKFSSWLDEKGLRGRLRVVLGEDA